MKLDKETQPGVFTSRKLYDYLFRISFLVRISKVSFKTKRLLLNKILSKKYTVKK